MFNHASQPTRIYVYGALEPRTNIELVDEQMHLAHRYRNDLVEIELHRRDEVDSALCALAPDLAALEADIAHAEENLEQLRAQIRMVKAEARKDVRPPELVAEVTAARTVLKDLRAQRKKRRAELFKTEAWKPFQEVIEGAALKRQKELRAASGLHWGTYLHVEQSMASARRGAPPVFRPSRGDGHLAVQIIKGAAPQEVYADRNDGQLRIAPVPDTAYERGGHKLRRTVARFRIGSLGRAPVWADVPIVLHRPLPPDCLVKWAHLIRRRIGYRFKWELHLAVARETWAHDAMTEGTVGVDVGWRMVENGLRVCAWRGDDGDHGTLVLPTYWLRGWDKVESLQGIRDQRRDELLPALAKALDAVLDAAPEWLREDRRTLRSWKSQRRLVSLFREWRRHRFNGDAAAFDLLETWYHRERHLAAWRYDLEVHLQRQRLDIYRNFAARMGRQYRKIVVEDMDKRVFHKNEKPEEAKKDGALKEHVRDAAVSILVGCLKHRAIEFEGVDPAKTTMKCHECGHVQDFDRKPLVHTCVACGESWDQDDNAAINIRHRASKQMVTAGV